MNSVEVKQGSPEEVEMQWRKSTLCVAAGIVAVFVVAVSLTACGGGGSSPGTGGEASSGTGKIVTILPSRRIPYYRDLAEGIQGELERQGWESDIQFGDQTVPTNANQVETAIVTHPDGMIVAPVDQTALVPAYRQASEAGIPIVTVSDNIGESGRSYQLSYVGHDYEQLGREKAEWIVKELNGQGTVGMIHAIRGLNFTEEQNAGAQAVFAENPGIEVIDGPYVGDFTSDLGLNGAENLLSRDQNLDALYIDNDDLALGAIQAVNQLGIPENEILIVGTDGGPPALEAVQDGELDVTWSLCGYAQGAAAVKTIIDYVNEGTEPGEFVPTKQLVLEPETIDQKLKGLTRQDCNAAVETISKEASK